MDCKYCEAVGMEPVVSTLTEVNGWQCPKCGHEEVESVSYKLEGEPLLRACVCENCVMVEAVLKTLYHHKRSSPAIVRMLTGRVFKEPPPGPTEEAEKMAHEIVERLIATHYDVFRQAVIDVTGEDPAIDWQE